MGQSVRFAANSWEQLAKLCESRLNEAEVCLTVVERPPPGSRIEVILVAPNGRCATVRGRVRELDLNTSNYSSVHGPGRLTRRKAKIRVRFNALSEFERASIGALMLGCPEFLAEGTRPGHDTRFMDPAALTDHLDSLRGQAPHQVLEVAADAGLDQLQHAYLRLKAKWAPNKFALAPPRDRETVAEIVLIIQRSYRTLSRRILAPRLTGEQALPAPSLQAETGCKPSNELPAALALGHARHALEIGNLDKAAELFNYVLGVDPTCGQSVEGLVEVGERRAAASRGRLRKLLQRLLLPYQIRPA